MSKAPAFRKSSLGADHPAAPRPTPTTEQDAGSPAQQTHRSGGAKQRMPFQAHPDTVARIRATEHAARLHEGYASMSEWMETAMRHECERIENTYNDGQPYPLGGTPRKGRPAGS